MIASYKTVIAQKEPAFLPSLTFYLENDQSLDVLKENRLLSFTTSELATLLTVFNPSLLLLVMEDANLSDIRKLQAIIHGLRGTKTLLGVVTKSPLKDFFSTSVISGIDKTIFIQLPTEVHGLSTGTVPLILSTLLKKTQSKIPIKEINHLISEKSASKLIKNALMASLVNPELLGYYFVSDNGSTDFQGLFNAISQMLSRFLPGYKPLEFPIEEATKGAGEVLQNPIEFQEKFGIVLPDWQQGIEQTVAAFLADKNFI